MVLDITRLPLLDIAGAAGLLPGTCCVPVDVRPAATLQQALLRALGLVAVR